MLYAAVVYKLYDEKQLASRGGRGKIKDTSLQLAWWMGRGEYHICAIHDSSKFRTGQSCMEPDSSTSAVTCRAKFVALLRGGLPCTHVMRGLGSHAELELSRRALEISVLKRLWLAATEQNRRADGVVCNKAWVYRAVSS